jgi:hypothetical protein
MFGAIAVIHGINYPFAFGRAITLSARSAYVITGVVAMIHPSRTVQTLSLGVAVAMYAVQAVTGKPKPIGLLRSTFGSTGRTRPQTGEAERE